MLELKGEKLVKARNLLFLITNTLDRNNIPYHLEGGTLLGIVRDGDLLPWDHDIDLSIDISDAKKLKSLQHFFWFKGLKLSERKYTKSFGAIQKGQTRIFKVKPIIFSLWNLFDRRYDKKAVIADIFVKITDDKHTYWQAKGKILRVCNSHYNGYSTIEYKGNLLKTPLNYSEYLSAKYGDWKIPVKEWNCKNDEKTICA